MPPCSVPPSPPAAASAATPAWSTSSATFAAALARRRALSITVAGASATASASACCSSPAAGPAGASTRPGFVHSWPASRVIAPASAARDRRAALGTSADAVTIAGLRLPISANTGIGRGRALAASKIARPPALRAREGDRFDRVVAHQREWRAPTESVCHQPEHARGRGPPTSQRGGHLGGHQLARARMARMGLAHDGAARGKRRGGVAAGDREGEREVAGREHGDRADRHQHAAQVRARRRPRVGVGAVERGLVVGAAAHERRERLYLAPRPLELALQAPARQPGLGHRPRHDRLALRAQARREARERACTRGRSLPPAVVARRGGGRHELLEPALGGRRVDGPLLAGARVDRAHLWPVCDVRHRAQTRAEAASATAWRTISDSPGVSASRGGRHGPPDRFSSSSAALKYCTSLGVMSSRASGSSSA